MRGESAVLLRVNVGGHPCLTLIATRPADYLTAAPRFDPGHPFTIPVASAVPARITAQPPIIVAETLSCRNTAPNRMPKIGITNVTVMARVGPATAMR